MSVTNLYKTGARWVGSLNSPGLNTPPIVEILVASNNTLAIFSGDFIQQLTDGTVYPCTRGGGAYATPTHVVVSVANYLGNDSVPRKGNYLPAGTTYTGTVSKDNPFASILLCIPVLDQLFALTVPTAEATRTAATARTGKCIDLIANAGSTVTGESGHIAYSPTSDATYGWQATTGTGQLRLRDIPQVGLSGMQNDPTQANWEGHFTVYEIGGIV
jgi:hypothetical protein